MLGFLIDFKLIWWSVLKAFLHFKLKSESPKRLDSSQIWVWALHIPNSLHCKTKTQFWKTYHKDWNFNQHNVKYKNWVEFDFCVSTKVETTRLLADIVVERCLLYILTWVWVLGTPNTDPNILFQHFLCKKAKKVRKSKKKQENWD